MHSVPSHCSERSRSSDSIAYQANYHQTLKYHEVRNDGTVVPENALCNASAEAGLLKTVLDRFENAGERSVCVWYRANLIG